MWDNSHCLQTINNFGAFTIFNQFTSRPSASLGQFASIFFANKIMVRVINDNMAFQAVEVAPTYNLVCNTGGKPRFILISQ